MIELLNFHILNVSCAFLFLNAFIYFIVTLDLTLIDLLVSEIFQVKNCERTDGRTMDQSNTRHFLIRYFRACDKQPINKLF